MDFFAIFLFIHFIIFSCTYSTASVVPTCLESNGQGSDFYYSYRCDNPVACPYRSWQPQGRLEIAIFYATWSRKNTKNGLPSASPTSVLARNPKFSGSFTLLIFRPSGRTGFYFFKKIPCPLLASDFNDGIADGLRGSPLASRV